MNIWATCWHVRVCENIHDLGHVPRYSHEQNITIIPSSQNIKRNENHKKKKVNHCLAHMRLSANYMSYFFRHQNSFKSRKERATIPVIFVARCLHEQTEYWSFHQVLTLREKQSKTSCNYYKWILQSKRSFYFHQKLKSSTILV